MAGYALLDGSGYISTPDHADFDITGDLEVIVLGAADNWQSVQQELCSKDGGAGNRTYRHVVTAGGALQLAWYADGTNVVGPKNSAPSVISTARNGLPTWTRFTFDVDDGAGDIALDFYTSNDPVDTALGSVSWSNLGSTQVLGTTTSMFSGAGNVELGARTGGNETFTGKIYAAWIYNGIGGTLVGDPDLRNGDQGWGGGAGTDSFGHTWTLQGTATWVSPGITGRNISLDFGTETALIEVKI